MCAGYRSSIASRCLVSLATAQTPHNLYSRESKCNDSVGFGKADAGAIMPSTICFTLEAVKQGEGQNELKLANCRQMLSRVVEVFAMVVKCDVAK